MLETFAHSYLSVPLFFFGISLLKLTLGSLAGWIVVNKFATAQVSYQKLVLLVLGMSFFSFEPLSIGVFGLALSITIVFLTHLVVVLIWKWIMKLSLSLPLIIALVIAINLGSLVAYLVTTTLALLWQSTFFGPDQYFIPSDQPKRIYIN